MAFYCKYCGNEYSDLRDLVNNSCSATNYQSKHVPFEGERGPDGQYVCKTCGAKYSDLRDLVNNSCSATNYQSKHVPYEGRY